MTINYPSLKLVYHLCLIFCIHCFILLCSYSSAQTQEKIPAADQVKENQLIDLNSQKYKALFEELHTRHGYSHQQLQKLFSGVTIHRKVLVLMDKQWEAKPYYQYWPIFINRTVIATGKFKLLFHWRTLNRIEKEIGVDREIVMAIWAIESRYGTHKGRYNVFRTLNTLFDAYPRRAEFFREELIHFLVLCKENDIDPLTVKGSYAGAFGQTQFLPSSFRKHALDFDGNGRKDVFDSTSDVLASIANYLHNFGWKLNEPLYYELGTALHSEKLQAAYDAGRKGRVTLAEIQTAQQIFLPNATAQQQFSIVGLERDPEKGGGMRYVAGYPNFQCITEWNHSNRYAMAVTQLAEHFR